MIWFVVRAFGGSIMPSTSGSSLGSRHTMPPDTDVSTEGTLNCYVRREAQQPIIILPNFFAIQLKMPFTRSRYLAMGGLVLLNSLVFNPSQDAQLCKLCKKTRALIHAVEQLRHEQTHSKSSLHTIVDVSLLDSRPLLSREHRSINREFHLVCRLELALA